MEYVTFNWPCLFVAGSVKTWWNFRGEKIVIAWSSDEGVASRSFENCLLRYFQRKNYVFRNHELIPLWKYEDTAVLESTVSWCLIDQLGELRRWWKCVIRVGRWYNFKLHPPFPYRQALEVLQTKYLGLNISPLGDQNRTKLLINNTINVLSDTHGKLVTLCLRKTKVFSWTWLRIRSALL
jgi:hypothetical protein